ncbi:MAG: bifunctional [glutamate--ammonia ligase]-adenylyl-L-tyrosine phosphorylase/[glutamate--ammonia-ligase] adenylyltransferase [Proteobacteria bacterium]|nr:bifunctional [glutamate--ammonia ligase]-adenylyl-L-tyrosine phosphorylase/[glutamate--ammonia-ligase] adenylyltransferase [Pseudomonadota bacterium]MBU1582469.1 bifunctional [glutamate--ammonia ligase]-adenylyl-L-tyrosine phosphorylase/[glutamate--ammonia-ligase] adenylyltransferase [Pseudomonadota bacterium]MBU2454890.1 bifunctional [glutamate--ammonia ligase]-adenylyl-L-tyrosine phosphorylase/[glutamate--ammonia-ligase] adenylyltransferase [Pseudomonadota bacterium]MBU2627592.1 bifunctiona
MDHNKIDKVFLGLDNNLLKIVTNRIDSFNESLKQHGLKIDLTPELESHLIKVFLFSEFIASSITRNPGILYELISSKDLTKSYSKLSYVEKIKQKISKDMDVAIIKEILLEIKLYETIRIAWRDLTGKALLEETLDDISGLATAIVDTAVASIYDEVCQLHGLPVDSNGNCQKIIVLGMGKLGANELNFSSDIDLIFIYPKDGVTTGEKIVSNEEFFTKVCRRFLKFFSAGSHEINFYRVDTRLRPYGDGGPLVMSSFAFEEYYQAQGREWERYAMIKAMPIAGDKEAGFRLLKVMNSFIYRRYFDYGSFDSFRDMKHRITLQVKNKKLKHNIKLGAGGIREIEFFGQLFQLIRGGVEPKLQERKLLKVLDLLQTHHCINGTTQKDLKNAYVFLRLVENRLQAYADLQTHDIPEKKDRQNILALSMGYDAWDDFAKVLNDHMKKVHYHFNQLLVSEEPEQPDKETQDLKELWVNINDPQFAADPMAIGGFKEPDRVLGVLRSLEEHPNTKRLTGSGRKKLARLIPVLVRKIGEQKDPDEILIKLIDLIITIERRTCYLSLLIENKGALETLITLARKSPWIITFLSNHPALLDELMHPSTLYSPPGKKALEAEMEMRIAAIPSGDVEFLLEELCIFRHVNMLRVSAADVSGNYPLMKVSDHLTYIAETVLAQVLKISLDIVIQKYGRPEDIPGQGLNDCGFAIIAYGKVGGLEMGYKSDIDIVFLHKGNSGVTRGGEKSIDTIRFYSNLGQRIINALTIHTPAGTLYGADMRLRPGGDSGMIVSHIEAFEEYMKTKAWTWEQQALIRARPVVGDQELCAKFDKIRKTVLTKKRDAAVLKLEVSDMRERMREERLKYKKDVFDLKQSRGCIIDIEFLVQYLVLKNARAYPDIIIWTDNMRLLESLDEHGIITGCQSERLQNAYLVMRKAIHRLNLQEKSLEIDQACFSDIRKHVIDIYDQFLADQKD